MVRDAFRPRPLLKVALPVTRRTARGALSAAGD